jgi:hypothetical protein
VTWGHIPKFLNTENPKLEIVRHEDFIPKEYLPTFSINPIEMNFHRIGKLSENFIYFNDDMIPLQPIEEIYYFRNNRVCDEAVENIVVTAAFGPVSNMARYTQVNNMMVINKYFKKREVQKKHPEIWFGADYDELSERTESLRYWNDFPGFHDPHMPSAFKKSTFKKIWELEPDILNVTSSNRFRSYNDVTQYLARYWQICEGDIIPRKTLGKVYFVNQDNCTDIARDIREQRHQMICINENCEGLEFETVKKEINSALEYILPDKSSFEW